MNAGLIISSIALGVSLAASAIKLFNWLIHSDPRVLIRAGRWLLFSLAVGSVPGLIALLMYERWALAMTLGAGMLIAPTVLNWRAILPRSKFRPMWPEGDPLDAMRGEFGQPPPSPELALRAAIDRAADRRRCDEKSCTPLAAPKILQRETAERPTWEIPARHCASGQISRAVIIPFRQNRRAGTTFPPHRVHERVCFICASSVGTMTQSWCPPALGRMPIKVSVAVSITAMPLERR